LPPAVQAAIQTKLEKEQKDFQMQLSSIDGKTGGIPQFEDNHCRHWQKWLTRHLDRG